MLPFLYKKANSSPGPLRLHFGAKTVQLHKKLFTGSINWTFYCTSANQLPKENTVLLPGISSSACFFLSFRTCAVMFVESVNFLRNL